MAYNNLGGVSGSKPLLKIPILLQLVNSLLLEISSDVHNLPGTQNSTASGLHPR